MAAHSAVGRKAGLSQKDYEALMRLQEGNFSPREHAAFIYAREWTFEGGREPDEKFAAPFRDMFPPGERKHIKKLMRMMFFANYCGNLYYRRPWNRGNPRQACELPQKKI